MSSEHLAETVQRLHTIVEPALESAGFELVELVFKRASKRRLLRLTIDRAGRTSYDPPKETGDEGVTISDCVRMSKLLSPLLDVEDPITGAYDLEVSSPGVNRPLIKPQHFQLAVGRKVRIKTRVPLDGESFFIASLQQADDERIVLDHPDGERPIPYRLISKANLEFDF